ncbi:hypothetical protein [Chitinimonas lacunae]|uniref:DUF2357 domain-containing protein n=1 Tax=Chitinimonas lacunae TaxID=1963018 RepID=A0ABV8MPQ9_9NEIS
MFDFKGLIDALKRRARDEAPGGPSATRMMADLPRNEALQALVEIVRELAELNRNPKVSLKERIRTVLYFDDKAQPVTRLLTRVYREIEHIEGVSPRQVLPGLLACWQEMAAAYKLCLKQHAEAPSRQFIPQAELATLRALYYYSLQAKWAYLRYFEVDPRVWRNMHRLYQVAESGGFLDAPIQRFPDEPFDVTVRHSYLRTMLLWLTDPDRRRPEQIWLIDDWLIGWTDRIKIEKVIRPRDQLFAINLDDTKPPIKLRRNMVGERYRYFTTEGLSAHLAQLAKDAYQGQFAPELGDLPPGQEIAVAQLLADLAELWSREGQMRSRRHERSGASQRTVEVVHGLGSISRLFDSHTIELREGSGQSTPEFEEWAVDDESAVGWGANYKARFDDHLTVGELIAMKPEPGHKLSVGIVRRVNKTRENRVKVGVEKFGGQPVVVVLEAPDQPTVVALYSADAPQAQGQRCLLVSRDCYAPQRDLTLIAGHKRYRIRLGPPLEELPEYTLCGFSVLEKQG